MRFRTYPSLAVRGGPSLAAGFRPFVHLRRQMPVGQGGFHIGSLQRRIGGGAMRSLAHPGFLYAYDCGSEPKKHVCREIDNLLAVRPHRELDLLVLSHFDRDHICGTPRLLRARVGFRVDTVMLPFVDMDERIVALAQAAAETGERGGQIDRFFVDMVFDPVGTLADLGARRIVLVRASEDDAPLEGEGDPDFDPSDLDRRRSSARGEADAEARIKMALIRAYGDPQRPGGFSRRPPAGNAEVLEVRNVAAALFDETGSIEWKLLPWVRRADPAAVRSFRSRVESLFGWPAGSFDAQVTAPLVRRQMVTSKRTGMARAYLAAFGDKNLTSMCLYSGPRFPDKVMAVSLLTRLSTSRRTKISWMGTGDAHLRAAADIAAFRLGFGPDLDQVTTYQFPHHGSIENSDPDDLIVDADLWVAAADPIHAWEHPHWRLQAAVAAKPAAFRHVRASVHTAADELFVVLALP